MKNCILNDKPNERSHSMWEYSRFNNDGSQNSEGPWCVANDGSPRFVNIKVEDCWQNWEKTEPLFPGPDSGEPWGFYCPEELQWDSERLDGVQENPFGPDDPWFSQITGIYYTQTE